MFHPTPTCSTRSESRSHVEPGGSATAVHPGTAPAELVFARFGLIDRSNFGPINIGVVGPNAQTFSEFLAIAVRLPFEAV